MLRIALTGGIACGKSVAAGMISEMGIDVLEADEVARGLMRPGTKVYRDIKRTYGAEVFAEDGNIDRKVLGRIVMEDPEKRKKLNAIVHPHVIEEWKRWLDERPAGMKAAAVVVPLLYEAGQGEGWDAVVSLYADRSKQVARLAGRGIAPEDAAKWLAAQMKPVEKARRADYVICNNGSLEELKEQIDRVMNSILEKQA